MLASGDGATDAAKALRGYGANIGVLDGPAGLAATRKLLRSVFYKGMAASIVEALEAARAAGLEDWLAGHIAEDLAKQDATTLTRIVTGTRRHAVRRGHEMAAAAEMLTELGVEPVMAAASQRLHEPPGRRVATANPQHLPHAAGELITATSAQRQAKRKQGTGTRRVAPRPRSG
jgi:3-hydroxyisobutyrate dehydrogenase-like beta-hydroxyacid dehydrogenase